MKYAGIIKNDLAAAPGICVSFFTQGCPHHCEGCQNPETWDFDGGKDITLPLRGSRNQNIINLKLDKKENL